MVVLLGGVATTGRYVVDHGSVFRVSYVILDGKVFGSDRCAETITSVKGEDIDVWYSGKARCHGGKVQAVMRPRRLPLWPAPAEPGSVKT